MSDLEKLINSACSCRDNVCEGCQFIDEQKRDCIRDLLQELITELTELTYKLQAFEYRIKAFKEDTGILINAFMEGEEAEDSAADLAFTVKEFFDDINEDINEKDIHEA